MPGRHRRRRGRGCARRGTGMLESALLLLLHHEPAHGYTLMEQVGKFGLADIDPSVIYRALRSMEAQGWVTSTWDKEQTQGPPRRVYSISALGDEVLAAWIQDLDETRQMIDRLLGAYHLHMAQGTGNHH